MVVGGGVGAGGVGAGGAGAGEEGVGDVGSVKAGRGARGVRVCGCWSGVGAREVVEEVDKVV